MSIHLANRTSPNSPLVIHKGKEAHNKLTIHTISHTTMAWDGVTEILDVKGTLETGGEKSTKWSNQRGECREDEDVELHRCNDNLGRQMCPVRRNKG